MWKAMLAGMALSMAQGASAQEVRPQRDFTYLGVQADSGGRVVVGVGAREVQGQTAICGLVWYEDATATTRSLDKDILDNLRFVIEGQSVWVQARSFNRYATRKQAEQGRANCVVSTLPWNPRFAGKPVSMGLNASTLRQ